MVGGDNEGKTSGGRKDRCGMDGGGVTDEVRTVPRENRGEPGNRL